MTRGLALLLALMLMLVASAAAQQRFVASLTGAQEVPPVATTAKGTCSHVLNAAETQVTVNCTYSGLTTAAFAAHTHGASAVGANSPILFNYGLVSGTSGTIGPLVFAVTPTQVADMRAHRHYSNIHTGNFPGGEIRGQIKQVHTVYDADGDGRTDVTVFRQSTNTFWNRNSLTLTATPVTHGTGSGDIFLNNYFSDFDGDGIADPLLLKLDASSVATWNILESATNTIRTVIWGTFSVATGDTLAMADYDGDGKCDVAVYRRSTGTFYILESSTFNTRIVNWGANPDFPSVGDYDGDGKADITVVRVEGPNRVWHRLNSSNFAYVVHTWGTAATDGVFFFAPFDIDGDGKQDIAVNRSAAGTRTFLVLRSSDAGFEQIGWGLTATDGAFFGDYDGDGKTDIVARRNEAGTFNWYIRLSSAPFFQQIQWGSTGDQ